jgi:hypothetical protein
MTICIATLNGSERKEWKEDTNRRTEKELKKVDTGFQNCVFNDDSWFYGGRVQTARFAYVTSLRVEGNQKH